MQDTAQASAYVRRLMREIEEIDVRIADLNQEKAALQRQLTKAHWEASALKDVSRKNSGTRIMVEQRILDALREAQKPLNSDALFSAARRANFDLKPTTFRTYLLRLKEKGNIKPAGRRGLWALSDDMPSSQPHSG